MPVRPLAATLAAAAALLAIAPPEPVSAASHPVDDTIAPAWGQGAIRIVRTGWTVKVTGRLTDTRADGDCVYVESVLHVDDWPDPDQRTRDHCGGPGSSTGIDLSLRPDYGSRLPSIRVRVCAADAFKDSCEERTYAVPPERAVQPRHKPRIDRYMNLPMGRFLRERAAAPGPFDWTADGCTRSPDYPSGFNFKDACNRHDFGYRNYGNGPIQASPSDETRAAVDSRFRADLGDECARHSGDKRAECEGLANAYHGGVRRAGGSAFYS